jgi:peptide chain release factor subunit 1
LDVKCKRCGTVQEKFIDRSNLVSVKQELLSRPCPSCSAVDYESSEQDIVDYLEELAAMAGSRLEIISGKSEEGAQIASLGRIGAILRFKPNIDSNTIVRIS